METEEETSTVLVKFTTKQQQYAVPGASVAVPATMDLEGLNEIVGTMIKQANGDIGELPHFDFIVAGQLLTCNLGDRLTEEGLSLEVVVEAEFLETHPPPTPQDSLQHDDWVSTLQCCEDWMATGCYDNTVHLWDLDGLAKGKGEHAHKLTIPAHRAPVKSLTWVNTKENIKTFISTSIDQTAVIWAWASDSNTVECVSECRGHVQSVECVAVSPSCKYFATGSWDNSLKLWKTDPVLENQEAEDDDGPDRKKRKGDKKAKTKTSVLTLNGHSENVGGVVWTEERELATASWDHSLRIWDAEIGGMKNQINGNTAFFCLSHSAINKNIIAGCADRFVRLYDPRASEGSVVQQKFSSHQKWVPSVKWSTTNEYHFISGSYDFSMKMWDTRSPKASLYHLKGHSDKVLAVDWSNPKYLVSGSADCTSKIFSSDKPV